ncbi:MAG: hypothetical protein V4662_12050 [Verrucomicrobiota bacterium]
MPSKDEIPQLAKRLSEMAAKLKKPGAAVKVAGRAVQNTLKKHFTQKNKVPNKRGWKKSGFWGQVRESTQLMMEGESKCIVIINDPRFMQRLHGGRITPKDGRKAISIPLKPEFAGINPSFFGRDHFILVKSKSGKSIGFLATRQADGSLRMCYVLRKYVDQAADPTALPLLSVIEAAAGKALTDQMARELRAEK